MEPNSGSWASWRITPESAGQYRVRQHGPQSLFDELAAAYTWLQEFGQPEHTRFGLTVDAAGQHIWLDRPDNRMARVAEGKQ
ncbi:hypothetical protein [Haloactinospora alba]|uniref:hypothetical protein n=1 Tax=Haloactinospora alba TaxID=405555 RepID=UPI00114F9A8F|nr:hypothetical protein [Haloactinospora alba]